MVKHKAAAELLSVTMKGNVINQLKGDCVYIFCVTFHSEHMSCKLG